MARRAIPLEERIILALDVADPAQARGWVRNTESSIRHYKIGLQLFLAGGFQMVEWIRERGHQVMLDLKFFDIPETVKLAMRQLQKKGIGLTTVHGNDPILRAAAAEKKEIRLLAVTVLTSMGEEDLRVEGMTGTIEDLVLRRARRAQELGCDGVVASGREAGRLRRELGEELLIVTPGIRPAEHARGDDQNRVLTAGQAIRQGADYLVVGRPITRATKPRAIIAGLQEEIAAALE